MGVGLLHIGNVWVIARDNDNGTCTVVSKSYNDMKTAKEDMFRIYYHVKECKSCRAFSNTSVAYCDQCGKRFVSVGETIKL